MAASSDLPAPHSSDPSSLDVPDDVRLPPKKNSVVIGLAVVDSKRKESYALLTLPFRFGTRDLMQAVDWVLQYYQIENHSCGKRDLCTWANFSFRGYSNRFITPTFALMGVAGFEPKPLKGLVTKARSTVYLYPATGVKAATQRPTAADGYDKVDATTAAQNPRIKLGGGSQRQS